MDQDGGNLVFKNLFAHFRNILYTSDADKLNFYNDEGAGNRHCLSYMTI
jgi:hypothetical protein